MNAPCFGSRAWCAQTIMDAFPWVRGVSFGHDRAGVCLIFASVVPSEVDVPAPHLTIKQHLIENGPVGITFRVECRTAPPVGPYR